MDEQKKYELCEVKAAMWDELVEIYMRNDGDCSYSAYGYDNSNYIEDSLGDQIDLIKRLKGESNGNDNS